MILLYKVECLCCFLLRAIYRFGSRIVINRTANKWQHVESDRNFFFICMFSATFALRWRTIIHAVKARALLLSNDQYSDRPLRKNRFLTLIVQSFKVKSVVMLVPYMFHWLLQVVQTVLCRRVKPMTQHTAQLNSLDLSHLHPWMQKLLKGM